MGKKDRFFLRAIGYTSLFVLLVVLTSVLGCEEVEPAPPEVVVDTLFVTNTDTVVVTETVTEFQYVFLECDIIPTQNETVTKVEVQAECADLSGDWYISRDISGFTGAGYIIWVGNSNFSGDNAGSTGLLTYQVPIQKAGTYRFNWRSYIGKYDPDGPNTEHNDSWLRIPDAADFYGRKDSDFVYPVGTGKTPNPEGQSGNGFFKVYMNREDEWTEQTKTSDHNGFEIFARFDSASIYTVEIARRSNWHAIDSFSLTLVE